MNITDKITVTNEDNMELMARYPDKYFDLAIVDPPYGLGDKLIQGGKSNKRKNNQLSDKVIWDIAPDCSYFSELFRVSKNQIIWGGNYFELPATRCNLIWDKMQENFTGADFELAWTSFDKASRSFRMSRVEAYVNGKIHICEKPIALYNWLLTKFSKLGDKILDTHLGSGNIAISCYDYGFELVACELDPRSYNDAIRQIKKHIAFNQSLFDPAELIQQTELNFNP